MKIDIRKLLDFPEESEVETGRFVVHEHHAKTLHYDFRLELDGTLRSWAIPKGPSMDPDIRRLAVPVANHVLSYIDFEGVIPRGTYGAGLVTIWDKGTFDLNSRTKDSIFFTLYGSILKGKFYLRRVGYGKNRILVKILDEYAKKGWVLSPNVTRREAEHLIKVSWKKGTLIG